MRIFTEITTGFYSAENQLQRCCYGFMALWFYGFRNVIGVTGNGLPAIYSTPFGVVVGGGPFFSIDV